MALAVPLEWKKEWAVSETDFDLLTKMTLELSEQCELPLEQQEESKAPASGSDPSTSGLIFFLETGTHTFCVRAVAVEDLEEEYGRITGGDPAAEEMLRAKVPPERRQYNVFPTNSKTAAEVLVDQMANRRHSLRRDYSSDLSDPGLNWWMCRSKDRFQIFFQSYRASWASEFLALGPLGDAHIACKRFLQALPFLRELFSINEFSASEQSISIGVTSPDCSHFANFQELFLKGEIHWQEDAFSSAGPCAKTLSLYFQELALKRRFWCKIESLLPKPKHLPLENRP